ncbi:NUDIX domain-containing protein [Leptolyngbya sp. NIES-2104]|uniref:NUDIX domain-containing protein n=1 Tax=Leptolyngbya sp. NIES-2104 TaxID=1552121 RepID=UPI0006EC7582|nr:NUDIX hydrolase [Leptolyngbya sp. NIES-2104]GAP94971.1 ADP-ribose pyrophosphatase [Leptolyngbya sp. NIES-2104]
MAHRNPAPTVDIIIELVDRPHRPIVLIERLNPPHGWAIPGGFIDYGNSAEKTAQLEAQEETGLEIDLVDLLGVYSDPNRDQRQHTMSITYIATAIGEPKAGDDAKNVRVIDIWQIPKNLCFDHDRILHDYLQYRNYGMRPRV